MRTQKIKNKDKKQILIDHSIKSLIEDSGIGNTIKNNNTIKSSTGFIPS